MFVQIFFSIIYRQIYSIFKIQKKNFSEQFFLNRSMHGGFVLGQFIKFYYFRSMYSNVWRTIYFLNYVELGRKNKGDIKTGYNF